MFSSQLEQLPEELILNILTLIDNTLTIRYVSKQWRRRIDQLFFDQKNPFSKFIGDKLKKNLLKDLFYNNQYHYIKEDDLFDYIKMPNCDMTTRFHGLSLIAMKNHVEMTLPDEEFQGVMRRFQENFFDMDTLLALTRFFSTSQIDYFFTKMLPILKEKWEWSVNLAKLVLRMMIIIFHKLNKEQQYITFNLLLENWSNDDSIINNLLPALIEVLEPDKLIQLADKLLKKTPSHKLSNETLLLLTLCGKKMSATHNLFLFKILRMKFYTIHSKKYDKLCAELINNLKEKLDENYIQILWEDLASPIIKHPFLGQSLKNIIKQFNPTVRREALLTVLQALDNIYIHYTYFPSKKLFKIINYFSPELNEGEIGLLIEKVKYSIKIKSSYASCLLSEFSNQLNRQQVEKLFNFLTENDGLNTNFDIVTTFAHKLGENEIQTMIDNISTFKIDSKFVTFLSKASIGCTMQQADTITALICNQLSSLAGADQERFEFDVVDQRLYTNILLKQSILKMINIFIPKISILPANEIIDFCFHMFNYPYSMHERSVDVLITLAGHLKRQDRLILLENVVIRLINSSIRIEHIIKIFEAWVGNEIKLTKTLFNVIEKQCNLNNEINSNLLKSINYWICFANTRQICSIYTVISKKIANNHLEISNDVVLETLQCLVARHPYLPFDYIMLQIILLAVDNNMMNKCDSNKIINHIIEILSKCYTIQILENGHYQFKNYNWKTLSALANNINQNQANDFFEAILLKGQKYANVENEDVARTLITLLSFFQGEKFISIISKLHHFLAISGLYYYEMIFNSLNASQVKNITQYCIDKLKKAIDDEFRFVTLVLKALLNQLNESEKLTIIENISARNLDIVLDRDGFHLVTQIALNSTHLEKALGFFLAQLKHDNYYGNLKIIEILIKIALKLKPDQINSVIPYVMETVMVDDFSPSYCVETFLSLLIVSQSTALPRLNTFKPDFCSNTLLQMTELLFAKIQWKKLESSREAFDESKFYPNSKPSVWNNGMFALTAKVPEEQATRKSQCCIM